MSGPALLIERRGEKKSSLTNWLLFFSQLDVTDDGFLSLMTDGGDTKDDVKVPGGEVGERIEKLFKKEEKDVSKYLPNICFPPIATIQCLTSCVQMSWS